MWELVGPFNDMFITKLLHGIITTVDSFRNGIFNSVTTAVIRNGKQELTGKRIKEMVENNIQNHKLDCRNENLNHLFLNFLFILFCFIFRFSFYLILFYF